MNKYVFKLFPWDRQSIVFNNDMEFEEQTKKRIKYHTGNV